MSGCVQDFMDSREEHGDLSILDTRTFVSGMKTGQVRCLLALQTTKRNLVNVFFWTCRAVLRCAGVGWGGAGLCRAVGLCEVLYLAGVGCAVLCAAALCCALLCCAVLRCAVRCCVARCVLCCPLPVLPCLAVWLLLCFSLFRGCNALLTAAAPFEHFFCAGLILFWREHHKRVRAPPPAPPPMPPHD